MNKNQLETASALFYMADSKNIRNAILYDRDEAKKPVHKHILKQFGVCPECNSALDIRSHSRFCGYCGQRLDWSIEDAIE